MQLYFEKHDSDIEQVATSDAMRTVLALWRRACRGGEIPEYSELNVLTNPHLAARSLLALPTGENDYQWVYIGHDIAEDIKLPVVGVSLSGLGDQLGRFFVDCYQQVSKSRKPLYTIHHSELVHSVHTWENLILPTRMVDGTIAMLMYNSVLQHHQHLLATVLETVHEGIISLKAVRNSEQMLEDATILSANTAAENVIGRPASSLIGKRLSEIAPGVWDQDRWNEYIKVIETGQSHEYQDQVTVDGARRQIRFSVNKMGDGLTVTLTDITNYFEANEALRKQAEELAELASNLETTHKELNREIRHRKALEVQLRRQAETDPLTGIANRRSLMERGTGELLRAKRYKRELSVLMIDIDHFKLVNDTYGHAAGDTAILSIAEKCRSMVRHASDLVGRLGGEEFAILLPETTIEHAMALAERVRRGCEELVIDHQGQTFSVTASIGVAAYCDNDTDIAQVLDRADSALYQAKNDGRNRVAGVTELV